MDKKVVWQPMAVYQPSYDFGIYLDRTFAKEMLSAKVSEEKQSRMNKSALETLVRLEFNYPVPLSFHRNTGLVTEFNIGSGETWLTIDSGDKYSLLNQEDENKLIKYSSHNVDNASKAYALMALVDRWAEYPDILIE